MRGANRSIHRFRGTALGLRGRQLLLGGGLPDVGLIALSLQLGSPGIHPVAFGPGVAAFARQHSSVVVKLGEQPVPFAGQLDAGPVGVLA